MLLTLIANCNQCRGARTMLAAGRKIPRCNPSAVSVYKQSTPRLRLCFFAFALCVLVVFVAWMMGLLEFRNRLVKPQDAVRCELAGLPPHKSDVFSSLALCDSRVNKSRRNNGVIVPGAHCDWSCPDPYSTELYMVIQRNCSAYRFIVLPADNGRIGHTMSQIHILLVFHRRLEALKEKLKMKHRQVFPHIPLVPTEKMAKMCPLFLQPHQEVYLNHEAVADACTPFSGGWVTTHISTWEEHAHELLDKNIFLETWPMHNMYLNQYEDIYRGHFQLLPKWACTARDILSSVSEDLHRVTQGNKSFTSVHVRRTDYLARVSREWQLPAMTGEFIDELVERRARARPGTVFVLLTDDEQWCREKLAPRNDLKVLSIESQELAFAVLTQCNESVVTYGSFGLWAGILSGGRMVRVVPGFSELEEHNIQGVQEELPFIEYVSYL